MSVHACLRFPVHLVCAAGLELTFQLYNQERTEAQGINNHPLPSTILDLARYPEEDFRAPLNTKKLAPVTITDIEID